MADLTNKTRKTWPESFPSMSSALTATCAARLPPPISNAATRAATSMSSSNRLPRRRKHFASKPWKGVRLTPSGTTAKAERDRTITMKYPAKPTQRTGESEAPAKARPIGELAARSTPPKRWARNKAFSRRASKKQISISVPVPSVVSTLSSVGAMREGQAALNRE